MDWSWALSLLQVGVERLQCVAFGGIAESSLLVVEAALPGFSLREAASGEAESPVFVFAHLSTVPQVIEFASRFRGLADGAKCGGMVSFPLFWERPFSRCFREQMGSCKGAKAWSFYFGDLRHAAIGGLTTAAVGLVWWDLGSAQRYKIDLTGFRPPVGIQQCFWSLLPASRRGMGSIG